MRPTIRQLEYVVAVAEEANFSRAAERCFVTQPSLSNQIRQLELNLGEDLFERTSKGVLTTAVGREVVAFAREILERSDRIVECARSRREGLSGVLRLGSVSTITPYLLPQAMVELRDCFPELELSLIDGIGAELEDQLERGDIDVLLVPLPVGRPALEEMMLARDPFVLVAPADSRLGRLPEPISLSALEGSELLLLDDPHCLRDQALEFCARAHASPHVGLHATSLSAIVQLVRRGLGATLLPSLAIEVELSRLPDIRIKSFADPAPGRTLGIAWRKGSPRSDDFKRLASILMNHAEADVAWDAGQGGAT